MPSRTDLLFGLAAATVTAKKPPFVPEQQLLCQLTPTSPVLLKPPPRRWPSFNAMGWTGGKGVGREKTNGNKKKSRGKNPHTQPQPPPTPQPSAWHNYSRSLSMAALCMRVTRDRRASGCRSADAAVPSSSGKGAGETASLIPAESRLHAPARQQPAPGRRGQGREGASPAMSAAGGTATPTGAACCSRSWQGARPGAAVDLLLLFPLHLPHLPFPPHTHALGVSILP